MNNKQVLSSVPKNIQILVVDDSLTARKFVKEILGGLGFKEITELTNGEDALGLVQKKRFDLVISDWDMPRMSGLELFKRLRSEAGQGHLRFLMVTSFGQIDEVKAAIEAGVTSYVVKPFSAQTIEEKLTQMFRQQPDANVKALEASPIKTS